MSMIACFRSGMMERGGLRQMVDQASVITQAIPGNAASTDGVFLLKLRRYAAGAPPVAAAPPRVI
jgi:hypothetical protein